MAATPVNCAVGPAAALGYLRGIETPTDLPDVMIQSPSASSPATGLRACVFDAYGTLLDFDGTIARVADEIGTAKVADLARIWRGRQRDGALSANAGTAGAHGSKDFWQITGAALDDAMAALGLTDPLLRARLMQLVLNLDPFADAVAGIQALRARGLKTAVLSNGTTTMVVSAAKHSGLDRVADLLLSTEPVGRFKPDPLAYALMSERLRLPAAAIAYVSANGWDAEAAMANGFAAIWLDRGGQAPAHVPRVSSLAELPRVLDMAANA